MRRLAFWLGMLLCLSVGAALAQGTVRGVVVNEFANVRVSPALGAEVIASVPGGYPFTANGRSPDNEWLRIDFNGNEGWVNVATLVILQGDPSTLPVADPRTIPYGGFESPRAGLTSASSTIQARLTTGLRLRAGPSTAYTELAYPPRFAIVPLLGRTASNAWVQINFEGSLGWVAAQYLEILNGASIASLPIDGIVADSLPISEAIASDYVATLRLFLDRLNLAQPSLDAIRAAWADAALAGRVFCHAYPARPSDYNIPGPLLAAYYPILNPLLTDFNNAMFNVRHAIDLFIEACNQPGLGNPVGLGTVQGALGVVNLADSQFGDLRRRLLELIPPDRQPGANECLLSYQNEVDILPLISAGVIYTDTFDPRKTVIGACFDAQVGQNYVFQALQVEGNARLFLSASPLDNPTAFIAVGSDVGASNRVTVGPALIATAGRYLLIISDAGGLDRTEALTSKFAYVINEVTGATGIPELRIDETTGQVILGEPIFTGITGTTPDQTGTTGATVVCPSLAFTCNQLFTCEEALACLAAGNFSLDPDGDNIPCEETLCSTP